MSVKTRDLSANVSWKLTNCAR